MNVSMSSHPRRGTTLIELVVACSLLGSLILLVVPSAIRIGRAQRMIRHDRIAMDEITNQLDRLAQLPLSQIKEEIATLAPSEFVSSGLPNPRLSGTLQESEEGYRLAVAISWDCPGRSAAPLSMATWVFPTSTTVSLEPNAPASGSPSLIAAKEPAASAVGSIHGATLEKEAAR